MAILMESFIILLLGFAFRRTCKVVRMSEMGRYQPLVRSCIYLQHKLINPRRIFLDTQIGAFAF